MRTQPWILAAAATAVASLASAEPETRPRIYYPRAVKRQITNGTPGPSANTEPSTSVSQSSTRRGLLDELLSIDPLDDGKTTDVEVKPTDKTDDIDDPKDEGVIIDPSGIILPGLEKPTPITTSKESTSTKESTKTSTDETTKETTKESTKTSADETTKTSNDETTKESTKTSTADEESSTAVVSRSDEETSSKTTTSKLLDLDPILTKLLPTPTSETSTEETTESSTTKKSTTEKETESASTDKTSTSPATTSTEESSSSSKLIELPTLLPEPSETTSEVSSSTTSKTPSSTDETSNTTVDPTSLPPTTTPVPPPSSTTTTDDPIDTNTGGSTSDLSSTTTNLTEPVPTPEPTPEPIPSSASTSESSATDAEPVTEPSTSATSASSTSEAELPATPIPSASSSSTDKQEEKPTTTPKADPEPTTTKAEPEPTTTKASEAVSTAPSTTLKPVTTTKKPEQDDDDDWLPTTIVREATSTDKTTTATGTGQPSTTATSLPSSMPKFILPDEPDQEQPAGTVPIQIGFLKPLNFKFVSKNSVAAAQIFKYLPNALADAGSFPRDKVIVRKLVPLYAPAMDYPITIAQAWFPEDRLEALKMQINTPNSALYHNDRSIVNALTEVIDSRIDLQGNLAMQNGNAGDGGSSSGGDSNNNDAFDDNSDEDGGKTAKDRATTAGIALGALSLAGLYGAAMFIVARRYKRKRQGHQRASSIGSSQASSEMRYNGTGSPALMGGALMSRDASNYGGVQGYGNGRDSQNSGQTGGQYSARNANISAPVATENSLGWN